MLWPGMTTARRQLLDAISAAPGADAARLVYADWLLASGDPLGELIVAQLSQCGQADDPVLDRRIAQLISVHQTELLGDLPLSKPVFRRGFIEGADITALDFTRLGAGLFERLPLLAELTIWLEDQGATAEVLESPLLGRLRALTLRYGRGVQIESLALNPAIGSLRDLALTGCGLGSHGCQALAQSPHLASLRSLEVGSDELGAGGARALSAARFAPSLRSLRLWKTRLGAEGLSALRTFPALERASLGFNGLTFSAVQEFAQRMPTLRELSLRGNRLGSAAIGALAPLTLRRLDLESVGVTDEGICDLAKLDLGELDTLILADNKISAAGVKALVRLPLPKLSRLVLKANEIGHGAHILAKKFEQVRVETDAGVLLPGR